MINFHVISLFPDVVKAYTDASILGRAQKAKKLKVSTYNPRDFIPRLPSALLRTSRSGRVGKHRKADDRPYGGGPGMVLKAEPILRAVAKARGRKKDIKILFFTPSGKPFTTSYAKRLAKYKDIVLIAGHYEGVDARAAKILKAEKVSIGPYVLTGGELPALTIIDAVARYIPGVLGKSISLEDGRTASAEVYTRPEVFAYKGKNYRVPRVLLSGHHENITAWRSERSPRSASDRAKNQGSSRKKN